MSKILIQIEVEAPDGIDVSAVQRLVSRGYSAWKAVEEITRKNDIENALKSDSGMMEFKMKYFSEISGTCVVRASEYGNVIKKGQEIQYFSNARDDPRRLVSMRGSLYSVDDITDYAGKVALRYLKSIGYTCVTSEDGHYDRMEDLRRRVNRRFGLDVRTQTFSATFYAVGRTIYHGYALWVNGNYLSGLSEHQYQYIQSLYKIIERTKRLDRRETRSQTMRAA